MTVGEYARSKSAMMHIVKGVGGKEVKETVPVTDPIDRAVIEALIGGSIIVAIGGRLSWDAAAYVAEFMGMYYLHHDHDIHINCEETIAKPILDFGEMFESGNL